MDGDWPAQSEWKGLEMRDEKMTNEKKNNCSDCEARNHNPGLPLWILGHLFGGHSEKKGGSVDDQQTNLVFYIFVNRLPTVLDNLYRVHALGTSLESSRSHVDSKG